MYLLFLSDPTQYSCFCYYAYSYLFSYAYSYFCSNIYFLTFEGCVGPTPAPDQRNICRESSSEAFRHSVSFSKSKSESSNFVI